MYYHSNKFILMFGVSLSSCDLCFSGKRLSNRHALCYLIAKFVSLFSGHTLVILGSLFTYVRSPRDNYTIMWNRNEKKFLFLIQKNENVPLQNIIALLSRPKIFLDTCTCKTRGSTIRHLSWRKDHGDLFESLFLNRPTIRKVVSASCQFSWNWVQWFQRSC